MNYPSITASWNLLQPAGVFTPSTSWSAFPSQVEQCITPLLQPAGIYRSVIYQLECISQPARAVHRSPLYCSHMHLGFITLTPAKWGALPFYWSQRECITPLLQPAGMYYPSIAASWSVYYPSITVSWAASHKQVTPAAWSPTLVIKAGAIVNTISSILSVSIASRVN